MRAVVVVVIVAAACATHAPAQTETAVLATGPTPIPWTTASPRITPIPTPTIAPVPPGVRACTSAELRAVEAHGQGATGWWVRPVLLGTTSNDGCVVTGPRVVRFVSSTGVVIAEAKVSTTNDLERGWAVLAARSAPSPSQESFRDGQALVSIWSYGDCDHHRYDAIQIVLMSADVSTATGGIVGGRCDAPGETLGVSASPLWSPILSIAATPAPRRLEAHIAAPTVAAPGTALHYTVTLTNVGDSPYSLRDCPSYIEWLGGRELEPTPNAVSVKVPEQRAYAGFAKERYMLNCAIDTIAPHDSVAFDVVLHIPQDALGPDTLRFELVGTGATASASITFTAAPTSP